MFLYIIAIIGGILQGLSCLGSSRSKTIPTTTNLFNYIFDTKY